MFLLTVEKKFVAEHTLVGTVLTALVAVVYHLFIPERYFLWFPAIPLFFYFFGLFYIGMFAFSYRLGESKLLMAYLFCKVVKLILSALVLMFYGFVIGHEVLAFTATYVFFFFAFLIFETRFFLRFEAKLKQENKASNEKNRIHSHDGSAPAAGGKPGEGGSPGRRGGE